MESMECTNCGREYDPIEFEVLVAFIPFCSNACCDEYFDDLQALVDLTIPPK